ncbi:MAG TPA: hypothetical protein VGM56_27190 [Byssovorax sp.]|jgi:hypothetical protein
MTRLAIGGVVGVALGVVLVAACAGSAPAASEAEGAWTTSSADALAKQSNDAGARDAPPPRCPYGALEDPHRGFVRCLLPEERDAGWLPPAPQAPPTSAPSAVASNEQDAGAPPSDSARDRAGPPPLVEIGSPAFENGQVPRVEKALTKASDAIGRCVGDHGGLTAPTGSMKVQFLVRARGRAEGVEVMSAKGVTAEAKQCVRLLLKNRAIGAPSADPVGVTVTLTLKPR